MSTLRGVLALLFILALLIWLVTSNLSVVVGRTSFYQGEFRKYDISSETRISEQDLLRVANGLIDYFNGPADSPNTDVTIGEVKRPVFNARELSHLKDVKDLIQLCYRFREWALAYLLGYVAVSYGLRRKSAIPAASSMFVVASASTFALVAMTGIAMLFAFDAMFLEFHFLSFSNNLWQLNPMTDYLIRIFPSGFFFDAAEFIAVATLVEAVGIGAAALIWLSFSHRRVAREARVQAKNVRNI